MKTIITKNGFKTTAVRSSIMTAIKAKNTVAEIMFRKALWREGYRYTLNNKLLPGKPDIVLPKYKTVIFIDGDFWHGYKWEWRKPKIKSNRKYWIPKIEGNMRRDKINNKILRKMGWKVIRIWEHEIKSDINRVLKKVVIF